ncbi:MAG: AAA family ATPase [Alphaproteobacteria bacterium]
MSEAEAQAQATDILLPGAGIAVFSQDEDTLGAMRALQEDWRFARVDIHVIEGGVEQAIARFETETSPDLLIIQTDNIDDGFTAGLGNLSQYCEEGTSAIIIGPVNDVYLYRQLIEMGVSDYLVRPVKADVMADVIAKALINRLGVSDSRLIACVGAKGGVGTTSLTQIGALLASDRLGQKTMLMDFAGGWSSLSVGVGFDPSATLFEIVKAVESGSEDSLKRMVHEVDERLSVLASGSDAMLDPSLNAQQCESVLDNLMSKYPIVFVDLSGADPVLKKTVMARANQILLVTTPTVTSLRASRSLIKEISDIRGGEVTDISLVVNRQGAAKTYEVSNTDIEEALEFKAEAIFTDNPSLFLKCESEMNTLLSDKDGEDLVTAFLPVLAKSITSNIDDKDADTEKKSGLLGGFLSKLGTK